MSNPKDRYGQPLKKPLKRNGCHSITDGDKKHFNRIININYGYNDPRLYDSCRCSNTPKLLKIEIALRKKMKIRRHKLMKKRELEIAPMGL
jgi:hypothetical protein